MGESLARSPKLWPHQVEALTSVRSAIARGGRTTLVGACGIGKTRIGGALVADLRARRQALVVLPTIELLVQTLRAYRDVGDGPLGTVVAVCSDLTIAEMELIAGEPDVVVTTTADVLAGALVGRGRATVLSTYMSMRVVAAAHANHGLGPWDMVIIDEAHRTTGHAAGPWKVVHHNELVPAKRRVYMTATPRVATSSAENVVSMDDTRIFGEVSYRLPFSRAIDLGLLADYRVVVPVVTSEEIHHLTTDEGLSMTLGGSAVAPGVLAGQIAVLRSMTEYGVRRAISFHNRVADAKLWAHTLPATAKLMPSGPIELWAGHVSGVQPPPLRRRIINRLADPGDEIAVVSNARVLTEGVDVPAVDAIVFSRPRTSAIDTIQAVGRALRTGGRSGKVATIVVPLLLGSGESPEAALEGSTWEPVWQVVRALRDHDDRLDEYLRLRRTALGEGRELEPDREVKLPPWLQIRGVAIPDEFAESITIRTVRATTVSWDEYFGAVRAYFHLNGHANVPVNWVSPGGLRVGSWLTTQRRYRRDGSLRPEREAALDSVNIVWDILDAIWTTALGHVRAFHKIHGHIDIPVKTVAEDGYRIGTWLGWQRKFYKQGALTKERIQALEQLGITWNLGEDKWTRAWDAGIEAAQRYRDEHGDLEVPHNHIAANGHKLGIWLGKQRQDYAKGKLSAERITALAEIGMVWVKLDHVWQQAYKHACAYRERNGHLDVPSAWKTTDGFSLGTWILNQRKKHREGTLLADQVRALEDIGIVWSIHDAKWNRGYEEARDYFDRNKDLRVHYKWVAPSGFKLGAWIADQRKAHGAESLAQARIEKLNAIGMYWKVPDETWQTAYDELKSYRDEYGNMFLPNGFMSLTGINLYAWCQNQRGYRNNGSLSAERIALLNKIGFLWDLEQEKKARDRELWMRRYNEVSAAMGEKKHPSRLPSGRSTERTWLDNQAVAYRKGNLDPERRELLEAIGVTTDQKWATWLANYEELDAFRREEGHFKVPEDYRTVDDVALASWKNRQRSFRNLGKLGDKEIALLNKIGFPWDPYAETWDKRYAEAASFKKRHGHLQFRNGNALHKWLARQRKLLAGDALEQERIDRLCALDENWADE
ncbi:DEAD/DEAH box helicase [Amycolatopsis sp. RTGN1]|uniref:DEAD/DEAH box helicase n=1 Tax=Amycolatopsis ponsaeliensis TaxID=2992142 RepID=UPI00254D18E5|nr:DEAD/DEAH box helicase [Amycolatopsis sp. RTGN1]